VLPLNVGGSRTGFSRDDEFVERLRFVIDVPSHNADILRTLLISRTGKITTIKGQPKWRSSKSGPRTPCNPNSKKGYQGSSRRGRHVLRAVQASFELEPMSANEATERELQSRRIHANRPKIAAGTEWTASTDTMFDGTYRHCIARPRRRRGQAKYRSKAHDEGPV
jgi:hypothetical protein